MLIALFIYILVAGLGIFLVTPWLKVKGVISKHDTEILVTILSLWPLLGPLALITAAFYWGIIKPGSKIFNRIENHLQQLNTPKPPPTIDEVKSDYRSTYFK